MSENKEMMEAVEVCHEMISIGLKLAHLNKCLKCKHKYEKKVGFVTGGIVGEKKSKTALQENIASLIEKYDYEPVDGIINYQALRTHFCSLIEELKQSIYR